jgi:hypothetical protein
MRTGKHVRVAGGGWNYSIIEDPGTQGLGVQKKTPAVAGAFRVDASAVSA